MSQQVVQSREYAIGHMLRRAGSIDHAEAAGLFLGERAERQGDEAMIVGAAPADPVRRPSVSSRGPTGGGIGGKVSDDCPVGKPTGAADRVELANGVGPYAAGAALLGARAFEEAIGKAPGA